MHLQTPSSKTSEIRYLNPKESALKQVNISPSIQGKYIAVFSDKASVALLLIGLHFLCHISVKSCFWIAF